MRLRRQLVFPVTLALGCGRGAGPTPPHLVGSAACRSCHQEITDRFAATAHANTSSVASPRTIRGSFAEGRNVLRTHRPGVYFEMTSNDSGARLTAHDSVNRLAQTERLDLVIGSGRKGQTYLFWRQGLLIELPVSYLTGIDQWINSPGYRDGDVDFTRVIPPRCLECHSTSFSVETVQGVARYSPQYSLGITCEKCHGPGSEHVAFHSSHPAAPAGGQFIVRLSRLSRERRLDNCALCHSGPRRLIRLPFSYRPGDVLDDYFVPQTEENDPTPDVHGDQIALLRRSKCFRNAPTMTCSTCHDVHREQRDLTAMAQKCAQCHQPSQHPATLRIGPAEFQSRCIDCHMPNQPSKALQINTASGRFSPSYRSHLIAVYPEQHPARQRLLRQ